MRKTYLFSIIFMVLWVASILLFFLPEISALNKRGGRVIEGIFVITIFSASFAISAIGIAFRCNWARRLHIYTTILAFMSIAVSIGCSMVTLCAGVIILLHSIMIFLPWIGLLSFGLYYLNRKDVIASFKNQDKKQ